MFKRNWKRQVNRNKLFFVFVSVRVSIELHLAFAFTVYLPTCCTVVHLSMNQCCSFCVMNKKIILHLLHPVALIAFLWLIVLHWAAYVSIKAESWVHIGGFIDDPHSDWSVRLSIKVLVRSVFSKQSTHLVLVRRLLRFLSFMFDSLPFTEKYPHLTPESNPGRMNLLIRVTSSTWKPTLRRLNETGGFFT